MLTSAEQKHRQKYEDQRPAVVTPAATKCPNMFFICVCAIV